MIKTAAITENCHRNLKKLAKQASEKRGQHTSIKAIVSALAADADINRVCTVCDERQGLMKLGELKRIAKEMVMLESRVKELFENIGG